MPTSTRLKQLATSWLRGQPTPQPAQLRAQLAEAGEIVLRSAPDAGAIAIRQAVLAAWSEIAAENSRAYVDLEASTPQMLVLVDEVTKTQRLIPVADLVRILGPRVAAA